MLSYITAEILWHVLISISLNKPMLSRKNCYREMSAKVFISQGLPYIPSFNEVSSTNLCEGVVAFFLFNLCEFFTEHFLHKVHSLIMLLPTLSSSL